MRLKFNLRKTGRWTKNKKIKWLQKIAEIAKNYIFKSWNKRKRTCKNNWKAKRESWNRARTTMKELFLRVKL